jgi:hypothetical protein
MFSSTVSKASVTESSGPVAPEYVVEIEAEAVVPPERRSDE